MRKNAILCIVLIVCSCLAAPYAYAGAGQVLAIMDGRLRALFQGPVVVTAVPSDGQVLTYDTGTVSWRAESAAGGGSTLAATLAAGNVTGGNHIQVTDADRINFGGSTAAQPAIVRDSTLDDIRVVRADGTDGANLACYGTTGSTTLTYGTGAIATGLLSATALGNASSATGANSLALGDAASASGTTNSIAIGRSSVCSGTQSLAIGRLASATGSGSVIIGSASNASEDGGFADCVVLRSVATPLGANAIQIGDTGACAAAAIAIGDGASSAGAVGVAIGRDSSVSGTGVAIGDGASAAGTGSFALGSNASTGANTGAICFGNSTSVTAAGGVAIGNSSSAGLDSYALGATAAATHNVSWAVGAGAVSTSAQQIVWGVANSSRHYKQHIQYIDDQSQTIERYAGQATVNTSAGASVSTSGPFIPTGSRFVVVTGRILTTITGPVSISVGDGTTVGLYATAISLTAGTTFSIATYTAQPTLYLPAGGNVTITAVGGAFTGGSVRVSCVYEQFDPPIS